MTDCAVPILYSFRRCPYAIRARMALHYAGIAVALREVALRDKPPALLAASPNATVPVLVLPGGRVIAESRDIMVWALRRNDPQGWSVAGDTAAAALWVTRNDERFKPLLDAYKYPQHTSDGLQPVPRERACEVFIVPLENRLSGTRFLFGDRVSWADVAIFPFLRQFMMVDQAWFNAAPFPATQSWLRGWLDSDLFAAVMHKQPPWSDPKGATAR